MLVEATVSEWIWVFFKSYLIELSPFVQYKILCFEGVCVFYCQFGIFLLLMQLYGFFLSHLDFFFTIFILLGKGKATT